MVKKVATGKLFEGYVPGGNWVTLGYRFPLVRPPRWIWADCNGGENDEKNNRKNEGI